MKYILTIAIAIMSFALKAQMMSTPNNNEKFIEVNVSDTIMVNPDYITLMVSLGKEEEKSIWGDTDEEATEEMERKKKSEDYKKKKMIEEILNKNAVSFKFHEKKSDKNIFSKDLNPYENGYELNLKSDAQLEKIKKELSTIKDVTTMVTETKVTDKEKHELILIDKVMKKAEREATALAKSMGVTLDKPINVSNQSMEKMYSSMFNNSESMGGFGALFSMMGNMFKGATQQNTQVVISKTLVVRFGYK